MGSNPPPLRQRPAWAALEAHSEQLKGRHLRDLFAEDPERGERMTVEAAGVFLDYSKNRITGEALALLIRLAEESGLRERIDAMFRGDKINVSEDRAVLHVALRAPRGTKILVDGLSFHILDLDEQGLALIDSEGSNGTGRAAQSNKAEGARAAHLF